MEKKYHTILVVDDNKDQLRTIREYLEDSQENYNIMLFDNPKEVLKTLLGSKAKVPDIIITDWHMPEISGLELLQHLKKSQLTRDIPVLIVTAVYTESSDLKTALDLGAVDYLRKPLMKLELWARVASVVRLMEASKALEDQKNRELSTKIIELQQKNQTLKKIKEELDKIMETIDGNAKSMIRRITKAIQVGIDNESEWQSFREYFEKVHPHFFQVLKQHYPKLSRDDLKYCAYLKIHLSTQEIANLLYVTPESVRKHKYRLKKKMNLQTEVGLSDFIQQFTKIIS